MKDKKYDSNYCIKIPRYPLKAYIVYYHLKDGFLPKLYYPIGPIYTDISTIIREAQLFEQNISRQTNFVVDEKAVVAPLKLERLYELKRTFWENPQLHYDQFHRIDLFTQVLRNFAFYKLVVTPLTYQGKTYFISSIPFPVTSTDEDIEKFMLFSDFPVDQQAKYAAIYSFDKPLRFNWRTGKLQSFIAKTKDETIPLSLEN